MLHSSNTVYIPMYAVCTYVCMHVCTCVVCTRALQWSGNPYGNGFGVEMNGNGTQFVKILWIGLDLGEGHHLNTIR